LFEWRKARRGGGRELERPRVEARRAIEGERAEREIGRNLRVICSARALAGAEPVRRERFVIGAFRVLETGGDSPMDRRGLFHSSEHRLSNAIVIRLDGGFSAAVRRAKKMLRAQPRERAIELGRIRKIRRVHGGRIRKRRARDARHEHEVLRFLFLRANARPHGILEKNFCGVLRERGVARELVDEERMSARFFCDRGACGRVPAGAFERGASELKCLISAQTAEWNIAHVAGHCARSHVQSARWNLHGTRGFAARRAHGCTKHEGGGGRSHDVAQRNEAVGIGPLQIVDDDEHAHFARESIENFAERRKRTRAKLGGIEP